MIAHARATIAARQARLAARFEWLALALETARADRRIAGSLLSAGVAFRLFLMTLPLALVTAAFLGFVSAEAGTAAPAQIARQYGFTFAIARTIAQDASEARGGRWILLGTGLILLLWTGNGVVQALSSAFRVAWSLERSRGRSVFAVVVVVVGLSLLAATTMATAAIGSGSSRAELLTTTVLAVIAFAIWLVVSWALPHAARSWTALVPGAILMAVGLVALHVLTVLFVANRVARASQLYGSLGFVSTLMLWLFLCARIMVGSAQLNATLWRRR